MIGDHPFDARLPVAPVAWHSGPAADAMTALRTTATGLTAIEAAVRLRRDGTNALAPPHQPSVAWLFVRQFNSPLIYLLIAAAVISLLLDHRTEAGFIAVVLVVNALIATIQERKAETSLAALRHMIGHSATVRRDDALAVVDTGDLVVGDIVELESGTAVPADVRLVSSVTLSVDQSTFSGESIAVRKDAGSAVAPTAPPADQSTMLHAGTMVAQGRGVGVVVATGARTQLGAIDASLRSGPPTPPPLVTRLSRLARQISIAAVVLIVPFALILWSQGRPADQILLLAVALAVSAVPEGLSIAVTVALAAGTRRMAKRQVIVRSLPAVEGLGACTLIASDKTGTLTQNRLSVERVLLADGTALDRDEWASHESGIAQIAHAGAICNEASLDADGHPLGDTVDMALLAFAGDGGADMVELQSTPRVALLPYEPASKYSSATVVEGGRQRIYVKGAPEVILAMCIDAPSTGNDAADAMAADGFRVIAVAAGAPHAIELLGWIGLIDPVRPEVPAAIARCAEAGIAIRMVTGDHPATALTIARQLGLSVADDQVVTGAQMTDAADRQALILGGRVFARIAPTQKLEIVRALAASGELVAVTGDGVNDAPALQAAHIGVAMGIAGTDVARGAADIVLADDNFASIVAGVEEGRITYANVRRIVIILLATGIAEIAMFLGAVATGLPMPLTAVQLLWLNLVTNGAQDVMLGFGRGEGDELRQPPRPPGDPILDRSAIALMIPPALVMTVFALLLVYQMRGDGRSLADIQNAALLLTVLFQNAYVLCMRSERRPVWREPLSANPWLLLGVGTATTLHLTAMFWPPLGDILGTKPVSRDTLLFCLGAAAVTVVVTEATKWAVRYTSTQATWRGGRLGENARSAA